LAGEALSLIDTFKKADDILLNAVRGISDLINNTGHINADFADVRTVMENKGFALMGTGMCNGPDRAIKAAKEAISSPLLEDISVDGATGIIINITGNESLTMHETNEAVTLIMEAADEEAEIIFGTVIDDAQEDNVKVTVVATGLGGVDRVTTSDLNMNKVQPEQTIQKEVPIVEEQVTTSKVDFEKFVVDEETNPKREPLAEPQTQTLRQSIQEAAVNYSRETTKPQEEQRQVAKTRAQSIAEKLGFMDFDEEELDTPTYLRKEDKGQDLFDHNN